MQDVLAIALESTLITSDKKTFIQDSKATERKHFGIIVITRRFGNFNAASSAKTIIEKCLNRYTKDEWKNLIMRI